MFLPYVMGAFNSIARSCFWCIQTEAAHLIAYGDNIETLRTQVQNLSAAIKTVQDKIEEAANRGATVVVPNVVLLLKKMASLEEEARKIIRNEEREADCRCLMGWRPNLWACYQTSKSAEKVKDKAAELLEKVNELNGPVATVDYSVCSVMPILEFEEFESRASVSNQIVEALKEPSVNMVGVYGMSGAGKTTLVKKIGADLQKNRTFSHVVLATVSQKQSQLQNNYQSDLTSIQEQIAAGLKIQLLSKNLMVRAAELRKQLQRKDKVLIILDDIWSRFELRDVGIPLDRELKVLITSRDVNVMNEMDSKHNIRLDVLSPEDSWKLFDRMADGVAPDRNSTARAVVEQCGGIPVLLVTIARALRNEEDLRTWKDALFQLERFEVRDLVEDVFKRLEVSYNFLPNDELRSLFVLCAQLDHRSIPIEDLLRYTMGLGLFDKRKKLCEVRSRLDMHLSHLKGCCLLQHGNTEGTVRMHDVVHKFAAFVAYRDYHIFSTVARDQLEEWPSKDEL